MATHALHPQLLLEVRACLEGEGQLFCQGPNDTRHLAMSTLDKDHSRQLPPVSQETLLAIRGPRPDEGAATWVVSRCEGPLRRLASASPLAASTLVEGMTSILMRRAEGAG